MRIVDCPWCNGTGKVEDLAQRTLLSDLPRLVECKVCCGGHRVMVRVYKPLLRPAGSATLPEGVAWFYVEAPAMPGLANRPDLPASQHRYGAIAFERALTDDERKRFDLEEIHE